jgi:hypothetical protein
MTDTIKVSIEPASDTPGKGYVDTVTQAEAQELRDDPKVEVINDNKDGDSDVRVVD